VDDTARDPTSVCLGRSYYFDMLRLIGRVHQTDTDQCDWSEGSYQYGTVPQEDLSFSIESTILPGLSGHRPFTKGEKVKDGSLLFEFKSSPSVLCLFSKHNIYSTKVQMSANFPNQSVVVHFPAFLCQPRMNHRKVGKGDHAMNLKKKDGAYMIGDCRKNPAYKSMMNTALGYDSTHDFSSVPITAIPYEVMGPSSTSNCFLQESAEMTNAHLLHVNRAGPIQRKAYGTIFNDFSINEPQIPDFLHEALEQHIATYCLSNLISALSEKYKFLDKACHWTKLYLDLIKIAKARQLQDDSFFSFLNFDHLVPCNNTELRHKVMYIFTEILYPHFANGLIDGAGRIISNSHGLVRVPFPSNFDQDFSSDFMIRGALEYPGGGKQYLTVTGMRVTTRLISTGFLVLDDKFLSACREESKAIQERLSTTRHITLLDWIRSIIYKVQECVKDDKHPRVASGFNRFIGEFASTAELERKLLGDNSYESLAKEDKESVQTVLVQASSENRKAIDYKTLIVNEDPSPMAYNKQGKGAKITRFDSRSTGGLPYTEKHPTVPTLCPGLTVNEILDFYKCLMVFVTIQAFSQDNAYSNQIFAQLLGAAGAPAQRWSYLCYLPNRFVYDFVKSQGFKKPDFKVPHVRMCKLITVCMVQNHVFAELHPNPLAPLPVHPDPLATPTVQDSTAILIEFVDNHGGGTFSPEATDGRLISEKGYVVCPLQFATTTPRAYTKYEVRDNENKSQGAPPVIFWTSKSETKHILCKIAIPH
jgi:hypothetical protein